MHWRGNEVIIDGRSTTLDDPDVRAALADGGEIVPEDIWLGMERLRAERDRRLAVVDALNPIRWEAMEPEEQQAWRDYRRALLDMPDHFTGLHDAVWPHSPA